VFVVGCLGDWRAAAAVLFERHSLSGHPAPSRKARKSPPGFFESSLAQYRQADVGGTLKASGGVLSGGSETFIKTQWPAEIAPTLNAKYGEKMGLENQHIDGGAGMFTLQPIALAENTIGRQPENGGNGDGFTVGGPMYTLNATGVHGVATNVGVVHGTQDPCVSDIAFAQGRNNGGENVLFSPMAVRRLTPIECERLQGFPDEYTNIPWRKKEESLDGPRYKALGNSMAVPVMHWIGKRISDAP
jgi:DNA (cytosine-5)-methyltransferase 1